MIFLPIDRFYPNKNMINQEWITGSLLYVYYTPYSNKLIAIYTSVSLCRTIDSQEQFATYGIVSQFEK